MKRIKPGERATVEVEINGKTCRGSAEPRMLLSDFVRHELKLYGTHVGCEHGICGACTVLVNGVAVRSCTQLAVECDGQALRTVEGLAEGGELNALQQAFRRHHALQCGFCTAGILMSATDLLQRTPDPSAGEVREMLSGHLCRCTGYYPIVDAILDAASVLKQTR
jgi:2-furoyl-CoA dehydrogenase 2Fe-2S iron sulfur subunit